MPMPTMQGFTAIADAMAQLVADGVPEPVAMLTIARRCLDSACTSLCESKSKRVHETRAQLARISRDILIRRDDLDAQLHDESKGRVH